MKAYHEDWECEIIYKSYYVSLLRNKLFTVCKDKTVLEFGPNQGNITKQVLLNEPNKHIVVEPNINSFNSDLKDYVEYHNSTLNDYYKLNKVKVDIVLAMGLFYHLHSPLHAIELILNYSDPDIIFFDSPEYNNKPHSWRNKNTFNIIPEVNYGERGMAQSDTDIKTPISYSVANPYNITKIALEDAGYKETKYIQLPEIISVSELPGSKTASILSVFEK